MSLSTPQPAPPQYPVAILAAGSLDNPDFLDATVPELARASISHIYTNGANPLVARFAADHGIPLTIFPLTGGRNLLWSTGRILEVAAFVYVVGDAESDSAEKIVKACVERGTPHREYLYEPAIYWKERVEKAREVLAAISDNHIRQDDAEGAQCVDAVKALRKVLK